MKSPMADLETPTKKEGVGFCTKHQCEMWEVQRSVPSFKNDIEKMNNRQREYQPRFCPECQIEKRNIRLAAYGAYVEGVESVNKGRETAVEKLARTRGIDAERDVIVKYTFADELSVVSAEKFISWLEKDLGREKKVKVLRVNRYLEIRNRRFMNNESKDKFLKYSHEIETADIVILDSLADVPDGSMDDINSALLSTRDGATIMIMTIPEADFRLEEMPIKLRYRFRRAQTMGMSSTGKHI